MIHFKALPPLFLETILNNEWFLSVFLKKFNKSQKITLNAISIFINTTPFYSNLLLP